MHYHKHSECDSFITFHNNFRYYVQLYFSAVLLFFYCDAVQLDAILPFLFYRPFSHQNRAELARIAFRDELFYECRCLVMTENLNVFHCKITYLGRAYLEECRHIGPKCKVIGMRKDRVT